MVLANSSQSSIVDDEPESEPQSEDVDAGETDPDWSDDEPDFDDAKSHESAQTDSVPPDATPGDAREGGSAPARRTPLVHLLQVGTRESAHGARRRYADASCRETPPKGSSSC